MQQFDLVRDFLRAYFPGDRSRVRTEDLEAVQKISGSWIDERELLRRDNDIAWLCKCSSEDDDAPFVLLVEFQTHPDSIMPIRLATYSGLLSEELHRSGKMKSGELPMILPVVLYSGLQRWTTPTQARQTRSHQPEDLISWQLDQKILLIDQLRLEETALPDTYNLVGLFIRIERSRAPSEAVEWILQMDRRLFENNTIDWSIPCIEQGREQGREQGLKEGEANGERRAIQVMLKKLFVCKFGPLSSELISEIESAEMDSLEKLVEEILHIKSIHEVGRFLDSSK